MNYIVEEVLLKGLGREQELGWNRNRRVLEMNLYQCKCRDVFQVQ